MIDDLELVVFDLAGTTVEDGGRVADAFLSTLRDRGIAMSDDELAGVRGASKREAIRRLIPPGPDHDARADDAYTAFHRRLADAFSADPVRPLPGAEDVFRRLRDRGIRVALTTGFDRGITDVLLSVLGWDRNAVDAVICGDDVPRGRPAPYLIFRAMEATDCTSVHRVAAVGDTALDLRAGHHAGVRYNIGVLSGAHDRMRLEQEPHTHILPGVAALSSLWSDPATPVPAT